MVLSMWVELSNMIYTLLMIYKEARFCTNYRQNLQHVIPSVRKIIKSLMNRKSFTTTQRNMTMGIHLTIPPFNLNSNKFVLHRLISMEVLLNELVQNYWCQRTSWLFTAVSTPDSNSNYNLVTLVKQLLLSQQLRSCT